MAGGREPISIEELVRRKQEASEKSKKPKFLSKAERERLALERRRQQVAEERRPAVEQRRAAITEDREEDGRGRADNGDRNQQQEKKKKKRHEKFHFEWKQSDDTLAEDDVLYNPDLAKRSSGPKDGVEGDGIEERKRRMRELEELKGRKQAKMDWDEVHWSEKPLERMRERDWRIFKEDYSIVTKGGGVPHPLRSWDESKIPSRILETIHKVGYKEPTPIQRAAIPIALSSRDVIGVAETGSGKTAGFVIPLLTYIMELPSLTEVTKHDGPYAIVLAPTRELAQQIERETQRFCDPLGFRCASIVGGHSIEEQVLKLQDGAEIIIATPGRLVDCIERRIVVLNQCCYVVMDEADRMIDLGFEESVNKILAALPVTNQKPLDDQDAQHIANMRGDGSGRNLYRQTMMFTATWPRAIERLAEQYLRRPGVVTIGNIGQATDRVEQRVEFVADEERRKKRMLQILDHKKFRPPIIIFVNYRKNCDSVAKSLTHGGWNAVTMYGAKSQESREAALAKLRSGDADCLVATDVAGRGIDVPDVSLVINFQMARTIEDYTHRIGRTGRAGKKGTAITFIGQEDNDLLYDLKQMIVRSEASKLTDELKFHPAAQTKPIIQKQAANNQDD
jgi:ATP-dependent RNA helicase DDX23/PRP28